MTTNLERNRYDRREINRVSNRIERVFGSDRATSANVAYGHERFNPATDFHGRRTGAHNRVFLETLHGLVESFGTPEHNLSCANVSPLVYFEIVPPKGSNETCMHGNPPTYRRCVHQDRTPLFRSTTFMTHSRSPPRLRTKGTSCRRYERTKQKKNVKQRKKPNRFYYFYL